MPRTFGRRQRFERERDETFARRTPMSRMFDRLPLSRMFRLQQRAAEPELMDDFSVGGADLSEALRHLRRLNRLFGAAGPALYGVKRLWAEAGKPARLTVLDIGCGSGDVNRRLLRWADRSGVRLQLILSDVTAEACREATAFYRGEPRVRVVRRDLFDWPEGAADIVTATQLVHHFAAETLSDAVRRMLRAARLGLVINDIHRHPIAWLAVWLATRSISRNRYIRHDGPLSVAKGFRAAEWRSLREMLNMPQLTYAWRPLFRYAVVIRNVSRQNLESGVISKGR